MKKIKFICLALFVSFFFSCEDAIDIRQAGELTSDVTFQSVNDLQLGLNGVYAAINGEAPIAFSTVFTDEVSIGFANGGQGLLDGTYTFRLNTTSFDAENIWRSNYALINRATRVIIGAENVVPTTPAQESAYNNIVAQAHILRAWGHFVLLSHFSTDLTDDSALGVIKVDFIPVTNQQLPRNTNGEVFDLINTDLSFVTSLTTNAANTATRTFVSSDFVKAFRARMAAYRGDYATASVLADELIAAYPLTARTAYTNIWSDLAFPPASANEVIFKLERVPNNTLINSIWSSVDSTIDGSPFYEMGTSLYNLLNNTNDIRRNAFVSPSSNTTTNRILIGKYPGSGGIAQLNDVKIFRAAEMYFIKAEAQANASDFAGVTATLQLINNARFAAGSVPIIATPSNQQAAFAEILKQRRIELSFEGHRYLDLKRLGQRANVSIDRAPADCDVYAACTLPNTDYRFTMPIPNVEIAANSAIRTQQNPGYTSN